MFNLEQQVVSLELAKRLKELNVKQESYFYWNTDKAFIGEDNMYVVQKKDCRSVKDGYSIDEFSAFTVAELGEMLPSPAGNYLGRKRFKCGWDENGWHIELLALNGGTNIFHGKSEADSRANMLIYLIENKIIHAVEL